MRSQSYIFLLVVLALGVLSGFLFQQTKTNYGLDVKGGIRFVYQMDTSKLTPEQRQGLRTVQEKLVSTLGARAVGPLGVTEPNVIAKGADQIIVELPGFTNIDQALETMGTSARIEFYHAKNVQSPRNTFRPFAVMERNDDDPRVSFRNSATGQEIAPGTPEYARVIAGWDLILAGEDLANANVQPKGTSYVPEMNFSGSGTEKMTAWSRRTVGQQEMIAAVLDGTVLSIASVKPDAFITNNAVIDGTFSATYVRRLVELLNAGSLPVDLKLLSSQKVDPTIGEQALGMMLLGGAVSFGVICLFLIGYYAFPGFIALIALMLYVLFTLTVLKLINATFSLAAIAGFILSVGMAVDANILVFERFKEEMKNGRELSTALKLGFKRALGAIVDSNACTILTSLVLVNLGTGPVKGFATTLIIGVAISLFTAVVVTRSLLLFLINTKIGSNPKFYAVERDWFGARLDKATAQGGPLRIVEKSKKWFIISAITVVVGVPFMLLGGLKANVEFRGGFEVQYALSDQNVSTSVIAGRLERAGYRGSNVKLASFTERAVELSVPLTPALTGAANDAAAIALVAEASGLSPTAFSEVERPATGALTAKVSLDGTTTSPAAVASALAAGGFPGASATELPEREVRSVFLTLPPNPALEGLSGTDASNKIAEAAGLSGQKLLAYTEVGPAVQQETIRNAVLGVVLSLVLICIYLGFRFGLALGSFVPGLRFGLAAIGAVFHDILVVLGLAAITGYFMGWEVSALFLTAMLTVIGFSVHDTIVIFDRIRENLRNPERGEDFAHLVNRSVTQSFSRSINTSMTVIVTLMILIGIGTATPDLKFFCAAMLFGILSGTYSSIYNASPILYLWERAIEKKKGLEMTLLGIVQQETMRARVVATRTADEEQKDRQENGQAATRSYGQVRRRASDVKRSQREIEDDL